MNRRTFFAACGAGAAAAVLPGVPKRRQYSRKFVVETKPGVATKSVTMSDGSEQLIDYEVSYLFVNGRRVA